MNFLIWLTVPPGDEGWLCPGCDCKDDCIDIVNDLLGTSLSLTDTWEVSCKIWGLFGPFLKPSFWFFFLDFKN